MSKPKPTETQESEKVKKERKNNSQIFQIPARKVRKGRDFDLAIPKLIDQHGIAEIADPTIDLDLVVQELFKGGDVEDLVRCRLGGVDDELLFFVQTANID